MPSIFRRVVGNFDPPSKAVWRFVKNHFALVVGQQYSEFEVLTFGAQREVGYAACHTIYKVPKTLGPKVCVLAVEVARSYKVGEAKAAELVAKAGEAQ